MGGNGPHSGARNSSFALATLRADGYAALRGSGAFLTTRLTVAGPMLTATVDFDEEERGSLEAREDGEVGEMLWEAAGGALSGGSLRLGLATTSPHKAPGLLVNASV